MFELSPEIVALSVKHCISVLRSIEQATRSIIIQMNELAKQIPEYDQLHVSFPAKGGNKTCVAPIAEIGDVRRFKDSKSLIPYAGIDSPPYQSCQFEETKRHISKPGSRSLRKWGYEVMITITTAKPTEYHVVYEYMIKKEAEGKKKKLVKIAGFNKFQKDTYNTVFS